MISRFSLLTFPDPMPRWEYVDRYPNVTARDRVFDLAEKLAHMDFRDYGAMTDEFADYPFFHFDREAQEFFSATFHTPTN